MRNQKTLKNLFQKLGVYENLLMDFENRDTNLNSYIEEFTMNFILQTLEREGRIELYSILNEESLEEAKKFILEKIPRFYQKLTFGLQKELSKIL